VRYVFAHTAFPSWETGEEPQQNPAVPRRKTFRLIAQCGTHRRLPLSRPVYLHPIKGCHHKIEARQLASWAQALRNDHAFHHAWMLFVAPDSILIRASLVAKKISSGGRARSTVYLEPWQARRRRGELVGEGELQSRLRR
jgi:hypothetical protein